MSPICWCKVHRDPAKFNDLVKSAMTDRLETLSPAANIADLLGVFDRGRVAIVMDERQFPRPDHAHRFAFLPPVAHAEVNRGLRG